MTRVRGSLLALGLVVIAPAQAQESPPFDTPSGRDPGLRRDATVRAVAAVGPAVANIATEELIPERLRTRAWTLEQWHSGKRGTAKAVGSSLGSGVVIDPAGYILTNAHVVSRATRIVVTLPGRPPLEAKLLSIHPVEDLALLKVRATDPLPSVRLAAPGVLIGETCIALGNPFGLENTVTRGVLSARGRKLRYEGKPLPGEYLQTDAAINPGNSGGPLINLHAELIGLNTAMHSGGKGIGFAIPVGRLRKALTMLSDPLLLADRYLGLSVRDTHDDLGAEVVTVDDGGPAHMAGIRVGDRIVASGPEPVTSAFTLHRSFLSGQSAQRLALVGANGERRGATLRVAEPPHRRPIRERLGIVARDLNRTLSWRRGIRGRGVLVEQVSPNGPAAKLGVKPGDLVLKIARRSQRNGVREAHVVEITGQKALATFLEKTSSGEAIIITLRRGGHDFWGELRLR